MPFSVDRQIMWGDLDSQGIVFYPRYYEWMDASGHLFFHHMGFNLERLLKDRHIAFGLGETACRYRQSGRYFQKIRIVTRLVELSQKTLTLEHLFLDSENEICLVQGWEKRICMDVADPLQVRATAIPRDIFDKIARFLEKKGGWPS